VKPKSTKQRFRQVCGPTAGRTQQDWMRMGAAKSCRSSRRGPHRHISTVVSTGTAARVYLVRHKGTRITPLWGRAELPTEGSEGWVLDALTLMGALVGRGLPLRCGAQTMQPAPTAKAQCDGTVWQSRPRRSGVRGCNSAAHWTACVHSGTMCRLKRKVLRPIAAVQPCAAARLWPCGAVHDRCRVPQCAPVWSAPSSI
jgi:hypothetical protein